MLTMSSNALDITLGAIIAIGTSIVSSLVLDYFHKRQECKEIKVLLSDELNEIVKELGYNDLRRETRDFYTDLKNASFKYSKIAGTLSNSPEANTEQAKIANEFY